MKRLYICRHGETPWTLSGQHTGKTDVALTEQGKIQAAYLRAQIADIPFDAIFCSPRKRAIETCGSLPYEIDPDLAEWDYGKYEGITSAEIQKTDPDWDIFKEGAPGGETVEDVKRRAEAFLKKAGQYSGNVAVFSHGHFLRLLSTRYLGLEPEVGKFLSLSVGSLSVLGFEKKNPVIILWNFYEEIFSRVLYQS